MRTLTFTFHGVGTPLRRLDAGEDDVWIDELAFEGALALLEGLEHVALTFDDGNVSDATIALPALQQRGLTATFFIVTDRLDQPCFLSREDVRRLDAAGMQIGLHGRRHVDWRSVPTAELAAELESSRSALAEVVGHPIVAASCPFGSYDRRVLRTLRRLGFSHVFTSDTGWSRATSWLQRRTTVSRHMTLDDLRAMSSSRRLDGALIVAAKGTAKRLR